MPVTPPEKQREPRLTAEMLTQAQSSLQELDWRLLHWLLRYPLQRADDLVVGVARWASRATVYRHLQALEASGLVESVLPKTPGEGKRLYHLSNLGLHVVARHLARPARELAQQWQADEAGLLRRLARLPTLFLLQEVVNSLVTGTAEAMTSQGRRPELVRWTWQRDVDHCFQYRGQAMRMFVDGVVALCIRTPQKGGTPLDQWYGLFLLSTELDDERLMRLLLAHPLLSHDELAGLLGMERKSMRTAVSSLHALGCLEPLSTSVGKRWLLCERGLRLIAVENHLSLRNLVDQCDEEAHPSPMVQRGVRWLLEHIQHTAGIYGFFAVLAQGARQQPEQRLC
jgi:predicted transcriptional regulator